MLVLGSGEYLQKKKPCQLHISFLTKFQHDDAEMLEWATLHPMGEILVAVELLGVKEHWFSSAG